MRSLSTVFVSLLCIPVTYGQLTVKPLASPNQDSYLYVDGSLLYVNQDVNLLKNADASATEASIYFRKEGQLIQGENGHLNKGDGFISIFQEGTSNAYDYNYWSSPVSDGNIGNGNFGIGMLYVPSGITLSVKALTTNALEGIAKPLTISSRWIYTYSGTSYSDWKGIHALTSIPAGLGFSMKGVNGTDFTMVDGRANNPGNSQRYDFRGKPNSGPILIPIKAGDHVLVGNPFPSALDLSLFLLENSGSGSLVTECYGTISRKEATTGIAYFWDSLENGNSHYLADYIGGYGAFSPVDPCTSGLYEKPVFRTYDSAENNYSGPGGVHYDRRYLPIAQGFMIEATMTTDVNFNNSHRIFKKEGENSDFKTASPDRMNRELIKIPKIRLEAVINDSYKRSFTLAFWPAATPSPDLGMDAEAFDIAPTDVGWLHDSSNFVIDVRPFSEEDEIPLFLKVEQLQAKIRIEISEWDNLYSDNIFILDTLYGLYYPMVNRAFQATLKQGIYHGRFRICFSDNSEMQQKDTEVQELKVLQNNQEGRLEIWNSNLLPIRSILLFDLNGKEIAQIIEPVSRFSSISTKSFANSVYIVKIMVKGQREFTQKINIQNPH